MPKILVIEDDENIRESLVELLEMKSYVLLSADNGVQGLEKAKSEKPDLILCDVMMPGLNGYEVIEAVRRTAELSRVPFVFLSAKAMENDVERGIQLGANIYLTKPFRAQELFSVVDQLLNSGKGGGKGTNPLVTGVDAALQNLLRLFVPESWRLI